MAETMVGLHMITQPNEETQPDEVSVLSEVLLLCDQSSDPQLINEPVGINVAKSTVSTLSGDTVEYPCFQVPLGRRKGVLKKQDRINMMHSILQVQLHQYLPSALKNDPEVIQWNITTTAYASNLRSWSIAILAKDFFELDDIMKKSSSMEACDQSSLPPQITNFLSFMACVLQTAKIAKADGVQK